MAQTRQETAFSDPSDLVARRMGFIPLPLGVAIARVLCTTLTSTSKPANILLFFLAYLILVSLRVLINLMILGRACNLISTHAYSNTFDSKQKITDQKTNCFYNNSENISTNQNTGAAIYSNSSIYLNNICLNDTLLNLEQTRKKKILKSDVIDLQQSDNISLHFKNVIRAGSEPILR
jgi:hypothetical protein